MQRVNLTSRLVFYKTRGWLGPPWRSPRLQLKLQVACKSIEGTDGIPKLQMKDMEEQDDKEGMEGIYTRL